MKWFFRSMKTEMIKGEIKLYIWPQGSREYKTETPQTKKAPHIAGL